MTLKFLLVRTEIMLLIGFKEMCEDIAKTSELQRPPDEEGSLTTAPGDVGRQATSGVCSVWQAMSHCYRDTMQNKMHTYSSSEHY